MPRYANTHREVHRGCWVIHSSFVPPCRRARWGEEIWVHTEEGPQVEGWESQDPWKPLISNTIYSEWAFLISKNNACEVQQDRANQILSESILGSYSEATRDAPGPQGMHQNTGYLEEKMCCNMFFILHRTFTKKEKDKCGMCVREKNTENLAYCSHKIFIRTVFVSSQGFIFI